MSGELISEQTCERCRADLDSKLNTAERRLNRHSDEIDEWKEVTIRLTVIQETQTKLLARTDERMTAMEQERMKKDSFFKSKAFEKLIVIIGILAIMITGTAIGVNVAQYLPALIK